MLYLQETGRHASDMDWEVTVTRKKREWILEADDNTVLELFGMQGAITKQNDDFINWMRSKLNEML